MDANGYGCDGVRYQLRLCDPEGRASSCRLRNFTGGAVPFCQYRGDWSGTLAIAKTLWICMAGPLVLPVTLNGTVFTVKLKVDFDINRENFGSLEDYHEAI